MLDLFVLHLRLARNSPKREIPVMWRPAEDHLRQRGERDLLIQERAVFFEEAILGDIAGEDVVGGEIAAVEREEEIAEPVVGSFGQGIEDGVEK